MKNLEVLKALNKARVQISNTKMEKKGYNKYSNYHYFKPDQVSKLVFTACVANGLLTKYDLVKDQLGGYRGELTVIHLETGEHLEFTMATDLPDLKATNASQKLGGMATFNERYLKMSAFDIVDNNLDFDSQDNTTKSTKNTTTAPKPKAKVEPTKEQFEAMKSALEKGVSVDSVKKALQVKYTLNQEQEKIIKPLLK